MDNITHFFHRSFNHIRHGQRPSDVAFGRRFDAEQLIEVSHAVVFHHPVKDEVVIQPVRPAVPLLQLPVGEKLPLRRGAGLELVNADPATFLPLSLQLIFEGVRNPIQPADGDAGKGQFLAGAAAHEVAVQHSRPSLKIADGDAALIDQLLLYGDLLLCTHSCLWPGYRQGRNPRPSPPECPAISQSPPWSPEWG